MNLESVSPVEDQMLIMEIDGGGHMETHIGQHDYVFEKCEECVN
jgi:hypothetical protein